MLALALAASNCLAGRGALPGGRVLFRVAFPALLAASCHSWGAGLLALAGFALWAVPGWGNGLTAITGRDDRDREENATLCYLADRLLGTAGEALLGPAQAKRWGTLYMSLRGLYLLPLFLALALVASPWSPVFGLGCALQGACYRLAGLPGERDWSVPLAELLTGALHGALLALALGA